MKSLYLIIIAIGCQMNSTAFAQTKKMKQEPTNPLLCDVVTGMCAMPDTTAKHTNDDQVLSIVKPVKVIYFTDPICSSCWGIEPQLRKLKLEYGDQIAIEYRMGGLLPDWSYNSGGISKPSDVAHHWDEVSAHYDMPIDGDVWLEDPLASSYPPSIAFKAAQMQDEHKAIIFLREVREMVFLQKKNICKWEHLSEAAIIAGLNPEQFKKDYEGAANGLFKEDLKLAKELGVRGFPTMFFIDSSGHKEIVNGSKPYNAYENAILKLHSDAVKADYKKDWLSVFATYKTLTAKEFSELTQTPRNEAAAALRGLTADNKLEELATKNGSLWILK